MTSRRSISQFLLWSVVVIAGTLPTLLAADFGGILPWSQFAMGGGLLVALVMVCSAHLLLLGSPHEVRMRPGVFALTSMLLILAGYGWVQTWSIPRGALAWIGPASLAAFSEWGQPIAGERLLPTSISIAPFDSLRSVSVIILLAGWAFAAVGAFSDRRRIQTLLWCVVVTGSSVAAIGLLRRLSPAFHLWSFQSGGEGAPFGTFLNRNNAALCINLALGSALGLAVYRFTALSDLSTYARDRWRWLQDPTSSVSLAAILLCLVGLLGCGSRGGLLSMVLGGALMTYVFRKRFQGLFGALAIVMLVGLVGVGLLRGGTAGDPVSSEDTFAQIGSTFESGGERLASDTRLQHWPDGFRAALHHLPAGSGLATYGFAYLPWQRTSPWRLCQHADNLWLEMLVELGVVGVVLVAIAGWLTVRNLRNLIRSNDPLDQGLAATGVYLSGVIVVSQFVDFGLILPANALPVVIVFSCVALRSSLVAKTSDAGGKSVPLELIRPGTGNWLGVTWVRERMLLVACSLAMLCPVVWATHRLRLESFADYWSRTLPQQLQLHRLEYRELTRVSNEAKTFIERYPHPDVLAALVPVQFQRGRLIELNRLGLMQMPSDQQNMFYRSTSRSNRHLSWRASRSETRDTVTDGGRSVQPIALDPSDLIDGSPYRLAIQNSEGLLRWRPLSLGTRTNYVSLEFVHQDSARTTLAIKQSSLLFRNTPDLQLRLGAVLADLGDYSNATRLWMRSVTLDANYLGRVLGRAIRYPNFPVLEVVPDQPGMRERADEYLQTMRYEYEE